MAERNLNDVPDILEENLFDAGMAMMLSMNGRFRDIASLLVRNALSKSIIHAESRDPADTDQVSGLSQYWINTTTKHRFFSVAGEDWINVTPVVTGDGSGESGDDGWTPIFSVVSDDTRRVLQVTDWTGGGGTKPATGQYVGAAGLVAAVADAVDIRGPVGTPGGAGTAGSHGWTPEIAVESDEARRVLKVVDWSGGSGDKPAVDQYLGEDGFTPTLALAINIRGAAGVDANQASGEIGRIFSIGRYTLGTSATPAAEHSGYTGGNLYIHRTASDGDKSEILSNLAQGDYIHVGTDAILEITAAPTSASSVYTLSVTLLDGEVPVSEAHTLYYIKENRALIAGAVHRFNIAAGAVNLAKLAAEVLSYWLRTVATDGTLTGDGTTGSPLSVAVPADNSPPDVEVGTYSTFGSWDWTSTSVPATGEFYVESGEVRLFETDTDSTDRSSALGDVAVGDRFQFGELNAFEVSAVGVRSGNGVWTFTGSWAEVFAVGDFDGDYTIRHIKKANVLARNNVVPGRYLRLSDALLPVANDPEDSVDSLWEGSLGSSDTGTATDLDTGKKFSDYTHVIFNYSGSNKRNLLEVPVKLWRQLNHVEISNKENHITVKYIDDNSFQIDVATGTILLRKIHGYKGI